jgi:hypothetical protein
MPACARARVNSPQIDDIQFKKIMSYIETGKAEGAKCLLGGGRLGTKGYYVQPTIFSEVSDDMTIAKEEIFGPVMQLMKCARMHASYKASKQASRAHMFCCLARCPACLPVCFLLHIFLLRKSLLANGWLRHFACTQVQDRRRGRVSR